MAAALPSETPDVLDPTLSWLDKEDIEFYSSQTGIHDEDALRAYIYSILTGIHPQLKSQFGPLTFTLKFKKSYRSAKYRERLLELGRQRNKAILLYVGCTFGGHVRKAIADGYPVRNIVACDTVPMYWYMGHKLYKTTIDTFPVPFIKGNLFDPDFVPRHEPFYQAPTTPTPPLSSLTSLTPLLGNTSAIYACAIFHFHSESDQLELARILASLLCPEPGSMILGSHAASPVKGSYLAYGIAGVSTMFCHSPESWEALWNGQVFVQGTVEVDTSLKEIDWDVPGTPRGLKSHVLEWSVTRV